MAMTMALRAKRSPLRAKRTTTAVCRQPSGRIRSTLYDAPKRKLAPPGQSSALYFFTTDAGPGGPASVRCTCAGVAFSRAISL